MIATSIRNNSMTAVIKGKVYTIASDHPNWKSIMGAIVANDEDLVVSLIDIPRGIQDWFTEGNVTVSNGEVFYAGNKLGGIVVDRILSFMSNGLPVQPIIRFVNKLMSNPSSRAVNELYTFLEHKNMPINANGNFLAYKGVQSDYYSVHAGSLTMLKGSANKGGHILNTVGQVISVPRNQVCDDCRNGCAPGLHAGSLEYAKGWGNRAIIVEIDPSDVVSIPLDCDCQKLRNCGYTVISDYVAPLDHNYDSRSNVVEVTPVSKSRDFLDGELAGILDAESDFTESFNEIWSKSKRLRDQWEQGYVAGFKSVSECR